MGRIRLVKEKNYKVIVTTKDGKDHEVDVATDEMGRFKSAKIGTRPVLEWELEVIEILRKTPFYFVPSGYSREG